MNYSNFINGPIKKEYRRKDGNNIFKTIKPFEIILFLISISLSTYFLFRNGISNIAASDWIIWVDLSIGIIAALSLSRRWKWSWLILAFDAILYGVAMFLTKNYAIGIVNMFLSPIILFFAILTWKDYNTEFEKTIETRKINLTQGFIITFFIFLLTTLIGYITLEITDSKTNIGKTQDWLNAFAASITLFAMIASVFRFRETWYLYFLNNIVKIVLFSLLIWKSYDENIISLILAVTYFLNSLYGMFIWKDGELKNLFKGKSFNSSYGRDPSDSLLSSYRNSSLGKKTKYKDPSDSLLASYGGSSIGKKGKYKDPTGDLFSSYNKGNKSKKDKYKDPTSDLFSSYNKRGKSKKGKYKDPTGDLFSSYNKGNKSKKDKYKDPTSDLFSSNNKSKKSSKSKKRKKKDSITIDGININ